MNASRKSENTVSSMQDPRPLPPDDRVSARRWRGGNSADFDDDFDIGARHAHSEHATSAGMVGFISGSIAIGLWVVMLILYLFLINEERVAENIERKEWMYLWFMFLDVLCFAAGLTAIFLGGRSMSPSNPLYRGWGTVAVILGILDLVGAVFVFLVLSCNLLILKAG